MNLISATRPLALLTGVMMYALGAGIAHYLGQPIDWSRYWVGQAIATLLQMSGYYLKAHFDTLQLINGSERNRKKPASRDDSSTELLRPVFLQAGITALTVCMVFLVMLFSQRAITPPLVLILGLAFLLSFFYGVPPVRLVFSGYGELTQAIFLTNLTPALAYLLQSGALHRLLGMITFPLTFLCLAMYMALSLPGYARHLRLQQRTLMLRLGWQRGMNVHNILILLAYLLVGVAALQGLPWLLILPLLLTLPLGMFQIFMMVQIANGAQPRWRLLSFTAMALVGLAAYLLTISLWSG